MPSGERLPLVWMPWPLSIRIFMGLWGQLGDSGDEGNKKSTSSSCKQLELDLILFRVQLGATGPPRYTIIFKTKPDSLTNQRLPGIPMQI